MVYNNYHMQIDRQRQEPALKCYMHNTEHGNW